MIFEKFPKLICEGHQLIWDSRQPLSEGPEWVFLPHVRDVSGLKFKNLLEQRPNARVFNRDQLGIYSAKALEDPTEKLQVIGVTGTNGKTTTVQLLRKILALHGCFTAEIGTLGVTLQKPFETDSELVLETGFTTPEAPQLLFLMKQLVDLGVTHVVMEVSSHALALDRVQGTWFRGAVFTNLTQDHLDFHQTFADYFSAKQSLFNWHLGASLLKFHSNIFAVLNGDDPSALQIWNSIPQGISKKMMKQHVNWELNHQSMKGLELRTQLERSSYDVQSSLVGDFNAQNIVGAVSAADFVLNSDLEVPALNQALRGAHPPGRLEPILNSKSLHVFVDYAHTPDALEKVLKVLRNSKRANSKLWVVFGCGGDRDRTKRPLMGAIASRLADCVMVTSDNPRTEDAQSILNQILSGVEHRSNLEIESEIQREVAIHKVLSKMSAEDVCLVAGKGHEPYQIVGTERRPYSDLEVCRRFLS
jgi:UDP-N-acetylmuramoyl-L-alanyl-D-glutamate--2,6-diaminopimelate ligase